LPDQEVAFSRCPENDKAPFKKKGAFFIWQDKYYNRKEPPEPNSIIWRFMELLKFKELLANDELYFH
jgi:hypothetical protein